MGWGRRKRWNSCLMWFLTSVGALCFTISCIGASDETQSENVAWFSESDNANPNGGSSDSSTSSNVDETIAERLMLVSTLDGKLSALDVKDDGKLLWSVQADSRPLLSSSISKLEIMHDGVPTRYIPSLDGGLYRYDGESIEAVPMTAETLLSASFKLADDTVMIGGKDLLTYGLNPQTGQMRYACGVKGCVPFGDAVEKDEDVVVLTRNTQTVRAVDARSGSEKWNFSVGQHDIQFMKGQRQVITDHSQCEDDDGVVTCAEDEAEQEDLEAALNLFTNSIKIVVPEGMVVGVNPENMQTVTWQYKFKSPISNAWLLYKGELLSVDMFDNQNIPALSSFEQEERPQQPPLLYVGMHQSQLYVQPSNEMQERMEEAADRYSHAKVPHQVTDVPRVSWKPYLNTAQFRTPTMRNRRGITHVPKETSDDDKDKCVEDDNALVIWHENYPFDNGFYLYPEFSVPIPLPYPDDPNEVNQSHDYDTFVFETYLPVTLWNWWKEVMAISILTSVIVNLILTHFHKHRAVGRQDSAGSQLRTSSSEGTLSAPSAEGNSLDEDMKTPSRQNSDETKAEYVSRYATDFEHIETLGKGGFGIVFESKNKVDECHYAVKRIALPNSADAKEKVMREVKALAKLDHIGIVRYFHAWIESPPAGWQEERDKEIEDSEVISTPTPCHTVSRLGTTPFASKTQDSPFGSAKKYQFGSSPKQNHSPNPKSPMDFLQNPFGGNGLELSLSDPKRGGSEEFSVANSNSNWEEEDESGSFSCGNGTPSLSTFAVDESLDVEFRLTDTGSETSDNFNNNCDKKSVNIPFSHNKSNNKNSKGRSNDKTPLEDITDSCQIVFEDSGCAEKSSKDSSSGDICIGIPSSQSGFTSESHDLLSTNHNSSCKTHSRSHSRTHSRSLSKDLAKLTIEEEGQCDKTEKKETHSRKRTSSDVTNRSSSLPKLYLFIQMQLCKRETLKDWLNSNTLNRDRHMVLDMFDQIVGAIEYVHDCGLMHRDLKPSNIFFSLDGVIKMGDFGLATALPQEQNEAMYGQENHPGRKHTAQVGTQLYMSPEQTAGKVYSQKVDIFSLGVILFELLYPFATQMERVNTLLGVKNQKFPERFTREMPNESGFVKLLLSHCPEDRPAAKQVLESDLLKEFETRRMPRRFRTRTVSQNSS